VTANPPPQERASSTHRIEAVGLQKSLNIQAKRQTSVPAKKSNFHHSARNQSATGFAVVTTDPLVNTYTKRVLIGRTWSPQSHADFIKGKEIRQPVGSGSSRFWGSERRKETDGCIELSVVICRHGRSRAYSRTGLEARFLPCETLFLVQDNEWVSC
jgi:hypothetical protein